MIKTLLISFALATSFGLGFAFNNLIINQSNNDIKIKRVEQLKKENVTLTDKIETVEYGEFVHILDVEGNTVELWEPNDIEFEKLGSQLGSKTTK
jgi:hypothetical protein